jgi:hypothetical protein
MGVLRTLSPQQHNLLPQSKTRPSTACRLHETDGGICLQGSDIGITFAFIKVDRGAGTN